MNEFLKSENYEFAWEDNSLFYWHTLSPTITHIKSGKKLWFNQLAALHASLVLVFSITETLYLSYIIVTQNISGRLYKNLGKVNCSIPYSGKILKKKWHIVSFKRDSKTIPRTVFRDILNICRYAWYVTSGITHFYFLAKQWLISEKQQKCEESDSDSFSVILKNIYDLRCLRFRAKRWKYL